MSKQQLIPILSFIIILWSCDKPQVAENPLWSSTNPFTIPTKTRVQKYLLGNLVANHSFEDGINYSLDTTARYRLPGWKKNGNVYWVNTKNDSLYYPNEVSTGTHALKILGIQNEEETHTGSSIESDFIKVIPGNYELTFDIRLKNIKSYSARLGACLNDAIDIKIEFFDKNKTPISGVLYSHVLKKEIDYSFKSCQFESYGTIDSIEWGRVRGRSFYPPIMDGIIPNNAQYVKLFFGLKGTGTMWLDNIDFRYAENNLSLLERTDIIVDSLNSAYELLVPQPKHITPRDTIYLNTKNRSSVTCAIVIPDNQDPVTRTGLLQLVKKLNQIKSNSLQPDIQIVHTLSTELHRKADLIISVGNNSLHNRYVELFPYEQLIDKPEGYFIYSSEELPKIIFLGGNTPQASNFAISTFTQLINDSIACIYNARIIDYPTFGTRGIVVGYTDKDRYPQLDSNLKKLYTEKFNQVIFDNESAILTGRKTLQTIQQMYFTSDIASCYNNAVLVNPFLLNDGTGTATPDCYDLSQIPDNFSSIGKLIDPKVDKLFLSFGSDNQQMLQSCIKSNIENWDVLQTIQNHRRYIKTARNYFSDNYNLKLKFIPAGTGTSLYFSRTSNMDLYYDYVYPEIGYDNQMVISSLNAYSPIIDYTDYYRFEPYTHEYPEMIYADIQTDALINTKNNGNRFFVGNKRLYSLISPCELDFLPVNNSYKGNFEINFQLNLLSPVDVLRLSTYADFCWNPENYGATESLWKVLVKTFGKSVAYEIIEFNDLFVNLLELLNTPINENNYSKINKSGDRLIQELENKYNSIYKSAVDEDELLQDIRLKYYEIAHIFKTKMSSAQKETVSVPDSMITDT